MRFLALAWGTRAGWAVGCGTNIGTETDVAVCSSYSITHSVRRCRPLDAGRWRAAGANFVFIASAGQTASIGCGQAEPNYSLLELI